MFSASKTAAPSGGGGFTTQRSVRLRSSANAIFTRTPSTSSSQTTFTHSGWLKRGSMPLSSFISLWVSELSNSSYVGLCLYNDTLYWNTFNGVNNYVLASTQVLRDPSAWYHIVTAVDTTQATASNRVKVYINGTQITNFTTSTYPTQNLALQINTSSFTHKIGYSLGFQGYFDGYLTEINFINGQQLTPTSFGAYNATTGVWQPISYSGSYGTNGFYLKFADNSAATAAAIGKDSSGNGNNFTPSGISVTPGITYDSMTDVPTLTSASAANFAVLNFVYKSASQPTISNGNLTVAPNAANFQNAFSSFGVTRGKWYCEVLVSGTPNSANIIGVSNATQLNYLTRTADVIGSATGVGYGYYILNGNKYTNNTATAYGNSIASGDIVGIALDLDNGKIWFSKNGTWQASGDPAAGTNAAFTGIASDTWIIGSTSYSGGATSFNHNFGQRPFSYTPPTGFVALNTFNLATPTIPNGAAQMAATTYTGTGSSLTIANTVNSVNFQPDFVWVKGRSGATDHALYDSVRGTTKQLESNATAAETTEATGLTAFGSTGFTVGALAQMNTNAATYVGWQWKASGTTVSNTSGSITSTVSANPTAGFSVVTYTGNETQGATVGHGLGVAPKMIIVKSRTTAQNWAVYHVSTGNTGACLLNLTNAFVTAAGNWNNTTPSSSVITLGGGAQADRFNTNKNGDNYVAYCFAEIAGYSAFGSYTGNGSTDGPFIYTGFRPKWVMLKRSDASAESWNIHDSVRLGYNQVDTRLIADAANAEATSAGVGIDILSNGFKVRTTNTGWNASGGTYIYAAFAENPFNYSLAR